MRKCQLYGYEYCPQECRARAIRDDLVFEIGKELYEIWNENPEINPILAFWTAYCAVLEEANKACRDSNQQIN